MLKKRILAALLAAFVCLSFSGCDGSTDEYEENTGIGETWAVYWYLCASNLESNYHAATDDLKEMMEVDLPDNVQVVIETGGARHWHTEEIQNDVLGRYVYDADGFTHIEDQPAANMGESETLADFLSFCKENYPADHTMVLFWNHGGGSVAGAAFDELYDFDALTLNEFHDAFSSVWDLSKDNPPFDLVGFDTCLMSSIDTAAAFSDIAQYMVASEEWEPAGGWLYSGWLQALADASEMDGAELGKAICDTYQQGCEEAGMADDITLSVTDLSRIDALVDAYDKMGRSALDQAVQDTAFFSRFGRGAISSENYGGNTRDQGYANMVDLGDLADHSKDLMPEEAAAVSAALESCVIYKINGPYRENATGLSCYYSYNGSKKDLEGFEQEGCGEAFKHYFHYGLKGELSPDGKEYLQTDEDAPEVPELDESYEFPLSLDDYGSAVLTVDEKTLDILTDVCVMVAYIDPEEELMLLLGDDSDIQYDWEKGVFKDNFCGDWATIDGYPVYMTISYVGEKYTIYAVPILLNGEECVLQVAYNYEEDSYRILGARTSIDENGMSDKNLIKLKPGDEITTIHYASTFSEEDDFEAVTIDTFEVTEDTTFYKEDMGDGQYIMMFELFDNKNNVAFSEMVQFTVEGEDMMVELFE